MEYVGIDVPRKQSQICLFTEAGEDTCSASSSCGGLFQVLAERIAQSREQFICKICSATRAKTLIQRGCQDVSGHGLVDGGFDRLAPLARVRHPPCAL